MPLIPPPDRSSPVPSHSRRASQATPKIDMSRRSSAGSGSGSVELDHLPVATAPSNSIFAVAAESSASPAETLSLVARYDPQIRQLASFDSLSREMMRYSRSEQLFLMAHVLHENQLDRLAPGGEILPPAALLAALQATAGPDLARYAITPARLAQLARQQLPGLIDIAMRNEDLTHYESVFHADMQKRRPELGEAGLAEACFCDPGYLALLERMNLANCRECSNAIAGLLATRHPQLRVATVTAGGYDHQFVLAGDRLPHRFGDLDDLDPGVVYVDPWNGRYGPAREAFSDPDAQRLGYVLPSLRYVNVFYDPLA